MSDVLDKSEREENLDESLFCDDNDSVFSGEDILVDNDSNEYHEDITDMEYAELDNFEEPTINENTLTYKCPNCGAGLVYDAEKQSFVCNFCISEFAEEDLKNSEACPFLGQASYTFMIALR